MNDPTAFHSAASDFDELLASIRRRRNDFDRLGHVPQDIVDGLRRAGIYRAFVPARLGGSELSPADFCRLIERIAEADGSTGWVASFGVSTMYLAALPPATFEAIYRDGPDVVFAGALFPPQPARRVDGGFRVSGRWNFCSGCHGASLIGVGIKLDDEAGGLPRMAVLPREAVTIVPNWDVIGMRATGSDDVAVESAVVAEDWTFVRGSAARLDLPQFRYPSLALAAQVLAVVGLGVARAALDDLRDSGAGRGSITGAPKAGDRANFQIGLARAEARLGSARSWFYEVIESAWQAILRGDAPDLATQNRLRMAAIQAADTAAEVTRIAFGLCGTAGIYNPHPLSRYLHDSLVVAQHAFLSDSHWQNAGRVLLGLPSAPGYP